MLAVIELEFSVRDRFAKLGQEIYAEFCERFAELNPDPWKEGEDKPPYLYGRQTTVELEDDGVWLMRHELPFILKRFKGAYYSDASFERRIKNKPSVDSPPATHIQVAIPNLALLEIRTVQVLEDACTDRLQLELDDGWRILAVCPPNSQRRPDYILGRTS
jgi:hypothetical protein